MKFPIYKYSSFFQENRTLEQAETIYKQRVIDATIISKKFSNDFISRSCPICNSTSKSTADPFLNLYSVSQCNSCQTLFVDPCPGIEALSFYYNKCKCNEQLGNLLKSRTNNKNSNIVSSRVTRIFDILSSLNHKSPLKILEVGCNSGSFLNSLKNFIDSSSSPLDIEFYGIDIDSSAIASAKNDNNIFFECSSAEAFAESCAYKFDLILHFELIEHLFDPLAFNKSCAALLNPNGLIYFQTPNGVGLDNLALNYNSFRPLAHSIFPPMHLQAFTTSNILLFLNRSGLKLKSMETPGNFDVDFVRNFTEDSSIFAPLKSFSEHEAAFIQYLLRSLKCTAQLEILASL